MKPTGLVSYLIKFQNGALVHRHQDQVHKRIDTSTNVTNSDDCVEEESLSLPRLLQLRFQMTLFQLSRQHPPLFQLVLINAPNRKIAYHSGIMILLNELCFFLHTIFLLFFVVV